MTVKELIKALQELGPEAEEWTVFSDGCDCTGRAASVEVCVNGLDGEAGPSVLVSR